MDMSLLPPCQSALEMHTRRVNYQVFVWLRAHKNNPDLPDIEESGWKIHGEEINYDWVKGDLIVPEQFVDILCDQNLKDDTQEDDSTVDEEPEFANLEDEVFENDSDEDD